MTYKIPNKESKKIEEKQETLTIYDIKRKTEQTEPYFFSHDTMKFFGQRLSDFSVYKRKDGKYDVVALSKDRDGRNMGYTRRIYNPHTNKLEFSDK